TFWACRGARSGAISRSIARAFFMLFTRSSRFKVRIGHKNVSLPQSRRMGTKSLKVVQLAGRRQRKSSLHRIAPDWPPLRKLSPVTTAGLLNTWTRRMILFSRAYLARTMPTLSTWRFPSRTLCPRNCSLGANRTHRARPMLTCGDGAEPIASTSTLR
ncbi:hypothetical protein E8E12_000607, partial [Didymella heteroderae]